ncbi:MAG: hypothetical protein KDC10_08590 [Calditrichaeota bacterium]|nr:hypothetical protein [Calditrichota bacterium]MCB9472449.1 hypothetical protein [Candidatus Delongbacteria bacterium]
MRTLLISLLLAGLLGAADAPYVPFGADKALEKGQQLEILPCLSYEKADFSSTSHYMHASQSVTVEDFDGRFYRVSLDDGSTAYIYRTELGLVRKDSPASTRSTPQRKLGKLGGNGIPVSGDSLDLLSPVLYENPDLLATSHLLPGLQRFVVVQGEGSTGFLEVDSDSLGHGWIYRVELDFDERQPAASVVPSRDGGK